MRDYGQGSVAWQLEPEKVFCRGELALRFADTPFILRKTILQAGLGSVAEVRREALLGQIRRADREGLNPEDYRLSVLRKLVAESDRSGGRPSRERLADLELLLTDTFLIYASHLLHGRVNPESIRAEWHVQSRKADLSIILQTAAEQKDR